MATWERMNRRRTTSAANSYGTMGSRKYGDYINMRPGTGGTWRAGRVSRGGPSREAQSAARKSAMRGAARVAGATAKRAGNFYLNHPVSATLALYGGMAAVNYVTNKGYRNRINNGIKNTVRTYRSMGRTIKRNGGVIASAKGVASIIRNGLGGGRGASNATRV